MNLMFQDQEIGIGKNLLASTKRKLRKLLQANVDVFAWENMHHKKWNLAPERDEAACKEVEGLLKAGIICEAKYPLWVANPVMSKRRKFDRGHPGNFRQASGNKHEVEPEEMFFWSRRRKISWVSYHQKGNPGESGKVDWLKKLQTPTTIKDMQSLNGKLVSLSRFVSKGAEKQLPFFRILKGCLGKKKIVWNEEAKKAFVKMKEYIAKLPTLTSPEEEETLFIYLAASKECISTNAIKGQVLVDFIAETDSVNKEDTKNSTQVITPKIESKEWKLYTDSASSSDGSGAGLMLVNPEGKEFTYALHFEFATTNNEAEQEALLAGLRMHYQSQNKKADALSQLASLTFEHLAKEVLVEVLEKKSILEEEVNDLIQEDEVTWMTPLQVYLETGKLPEDKNEARKIRIKAPSYKIINGALYRRSFFTPWLRFVGPKQATVIIQEMYEGICGLHAGPRSVVAKIIRLGYYWPTMHHDTTTVLQTCESCQIHSNVPRLPMQELISVTSAWPFMKWGIGIVGPINDTPGSPRFILVAIDYFTKWVKAKPLAAITGKQIEKFVWEHIVCRFGVPQEIVSDNGKQFAEGIFLKFCKQLKIQQNFTSVYHPQGNGQVEVTNRDIIKGIEKRLGKCKKGWVDELPLVLWAHRTTPKRSNGETPYSLAYGTT
ncbi:uncharacterized protein [Rutidosis leptorrhynchoides]|uniref:uncharacterized protein n=1 Tax=Rutidosis leptorrhynchoides TaxID=125765 RepID=UPI003A9A44D5